MKEVKCPCCQNSLVLKDGKLSAVSGAEIRGLRKQGFTVKQIANALKIPLSLVKREAEMTGDAGLE